MSPWPQIQGPKTTRHLGKLRALARGDVSPPARAYSTCMVLRGEDAGQTS